MADRTDLVADIGETFVLAAQYLDSNRAPVNMTGAHAEFIIHRVGDPNRDVLTYPGVIDIPSGTITFTVADEVTALWAFARASYRVVVESAGGVRTRLFEGLIGADRGL